MFSNLCPLPVKTALAVTPEAGAQCVNSARWDLCGGRRATGGPTATMKDVRDLAGSDRLAIDSAHDQVLCGPNSHGFATVSRDTFVESVEAVAELADGTLRNTVGGAEPPITAQLVLVSAVPNPVGDDRRHAPSTIFFFHSETCTGWISYCFAIS